MESGINLGGVSQEQHVILLVEDEFKLRTSLAEYLTLKGNKVFCAASGEEGLDVFYSNNTEIDIILLDIMLPGINGYQVLDEVRTDSSIPVIMLTACADEQKQLKSFRYGADAYMTKPFRPSVLNAQIDALLRRTSVKFDTREYGTLRIDTRQHKAFNNLENLQLTPKEYSLLLYFADNINTVLNRQQILDAVWGFDYSGGTRTVDTVVKHLRSKIDDTGCNIESLYGVGYRFEVPDEINT